jgi:hypothetical protein
MNRRLVGALVVAFAVAAALAAPAGALVAGDARPAPLPPEPVVGDCVTGEIPEALDFDPETVTVGEELTTPFSACEGEVSGEVVLVASARGDLDARLRAANDLSDDCARATRLVAGIDVAERASRGSSIRWTLSPNARYRWVMPDPRSRAGGQTWLACVATPPFAEPYPGSVASAFSGGRLPDAFGSCWADAVIDAGLTSAPCSGPHRAELIAVGRPWRGGISTELAEDSCRAMAARVTGRADPTARGDVEIRLYPANLEGRYARQTVRPDLVCYVIGAAERQIVGTVVGVGDRPLPFA